MFEWLNVVNPTLLYSVAGGVIAFFKGVKFIQEGERGCKVRFGKVVRDKNGQPIVYEPGFVLLIPFVDTLNRRHVRQQTMQFDDQDIINAENLVFRINAVIMFHVEDVYRALFNVDDLEISIQHFCMGILRDILQPKTTEALKDTHAISSELLAHLCSMEENWGVKFIDAKLTSCSPTSNSAQILSAKQSAQIKAEATLEVIKTLGIDKSNLETFQAILGAIVGIPVVTALQQPLVGLANNKNNE
jgi:regulator of protease activity HflC (stomatin/prohibitin superfamily)